MRNNYPAQIDETLRPDCFAGGGEMGEQLRSHPWADTPLGPVATWPASLRTGVTLCLTAPVPMALFWGPEFIGFYNDAFKPLVSAEVMNVAGCPGSALPAELWRRLQPELAETRRTGLARRLTDLSFSAKRPHRWADRAFTGSFSPVFNEAGTVAGVLTTFSEQAATEAAGEPQFALFLQNLPGAAWMKDLQGRYVYANDEAVRIFKTERAELYGRTDAEIFPPDTAEHFRTNDRQALATGSTLQTIEVLPQADGLHFSIVAKFPVIDSTGTAGYVAGIAIDITEWHQASEALKRSEARYRALVEAADQIVWVWDPVTETGDFTDRVNWWTEMTGQPREQQAGLGWLAMIHEQDRERVQAAWLKALETGTGYQVEYRLHTQNGKLVNVLTRAVPVRDAAGTVHEWVGTSTDVSEKRQAEAALRETEERLHLALNAARMIAWDWDLATDQVVCSENAPDFWGRQAGLAQDFFTAIHPDDLPVLSAARERAVNDKMGNYFSEYRVIGPQQQLFWLVSRGQVQFDAQGRAHRIIGLSTDITERKQAEEALRQSERLYRAIGESIDYGVWVCEPDGRNIYASESFLKLVGITQEECSEFGWGDVLHPDESAATIAAWKECARTGTFWEREHRFRGVDGQWHHVLARGVPIRNDQGEIICWAGINLNISALKQSEQAWRESEARFRQLADSMPQIIWAARPDGQLDYYNQRWYDLTGAAADGQGDESWLPILHPDDRQKCLDRWYHSVRTGQPYEIEYRFQHPDTGEYRWHLGRALPIRNAAGQIIRWYGTSTDIHDQKMAEYALREADRRKDEFLAMLAHELRNPLAPIRNAVQVLRLLGPKDLQLQWARDLIDRQVEHLTRLVDDLLDVSRITQGKITLKKEPLELGTIIARAVETSRPLIDARRHKLTVAMPGEPIRLEGDLTRLAQVVANLLNNAAKYMEDGGQIWLSVERGEGEISLHVRDTGLGIPAEVLPHIFDLFAQADRSLDRSQGGLGIGLTLVRNLVEMHGGKVEAFSAGPGQGSEFIVRLPLLVAPDNQPEMIATNDTPSIQTTALRILVVDDNIDIAESMALLLQFSGHEVRIANEGHQAIELAAAFHPQVVLLDIGLPGMNGYEVAQRLRRQPTLEQALFIALTGYGQEKDKQRSKEAGFDHHLVKPIDPPALEALLNSLMTDGPGK